MAGFGLSQDVDGVWRWVCDCEAAGRDPLFRDALRAALAHLSEPCPVLGRPLGLLGIHERLPPQA